MIDKQGSYVINPDQQSQNENNESDQMPKGCTQVQNVNSCSGNNQHKVKIPSLYLHFFFDGTGNNKHNTKVRLDQLQDQDYLAIRKGTIFLDSKEKCDEYASKDNYNNFNISFMDLHNKCEDYKQDVEYKIENEFGNKPKYIDVLSPIEKALQNIDRPEKPKLTHNDYVDNPNLYEYNNKISPYKKVDREYALNKDNKKYLNKYDDLSYYNYYSNIALLSDAINISKFNSHFVFYIGGAGTISFGKDMVDGAAFATGETGVNERIIQAINELKILLKKLQKNKDLTATGNNQDKITIYINLYGFSRGSFYARNFYSELKKLINSNDPDLKQYEYLFKFKLGIFLDTVTSEGFVHSNDVKPFSLDQSYDDMSVYHICAQDEFRYHFPLTSIPKCLKNNKNSIEIKIPGSHSDIGGGYSEVCNEKDLDLGFATLDDNFNHNYEYVPFYWFLNKGFYSLKEDGRFFDTNSTPNVNGALTIRDRKVRCINRRIYYPYQFVTAKIMQTIMIDTFGQNILNKESELCKQIDNLKNWEIDKDGEHIDGIFTLADYADRIIQWLPFRDNDNDKDIEKNEITKAEFQRSNIFDPTKGEQALSEATMKYIYNNFIHYSLVNSDKLSLGDVNMTQNQKTGFYIAYHANLQESTAIKIDNIYDIDLTAHFPYFAQSKIRTKESESMKYAPELDKKTQEALQKFDRFILGADYDKFICLKNDQGNIKADYGYLQEKFNTTNITVNYNSNNNVYLTPFDNEVISFCPIERVEITRDRPFLLDTEATKAM